MLQKNFLLLLRFIEIDHLEQQCSAQLLNTVDS